MLNSILGNAYVTVVLIAFFGITIFVHELGHYLVARACGLVIDVFSIGFGPAIWKRRYKGTVYKIGWIPFGGYVALPQLDPAGMNVIQGQEGAEGNSGGEGGTQLPRISAQKKILVSLAGATGNVLLAIGIAWAVYWIGMPATTANQDAVIGFVDTSSDAYRQGLRIGDRLLTANKIEVAKWSDFVQEASLSDKVNMSVRGADGAVKTLTLPTEKWRYGMRMVPGIESREPCAVATVTPGMSAAEAGLQPGDVIVTFAGEEVMSRGHLIELVGRHKDETVAAGIERKAEGQTQSLVVSLRPVNDPATQQTRIGIAFSMLPPDLSTETRIHPLPLEQLRHHASAIFRFLVDLVTPKRAGKAAGMVGGPVAIISYYVSMIKASLMLAIWFTGFLNVNLAIINLLPIPVLDGGHVTFSLWELITRKPASAKVVNVLTNFFMVLIIGVFLYISLRDVDRFTPLGRYLRGWYARLTSAGPAPNDGGE